MLEKNICFKTRECGKTSCMNSLWTHFWHQENPRPRSYPLSTGMKKTAKHTHVKESNGFIVFNNLHRLLLAQVESFVVTIIVIPEVMTISECSDTLTITVIWFFVSPITDGYSSSVNTIPTVFSTVRLSSSSYPWITCPTCIGKRAMCLTCYTKVFWSIFWKTAA